MFSLLIHLNLYTDFNFKLFTPFYNKFDFYTNFFFSFDWNEEKNKIYSLDIFPSIFVTDKRVFFLLNST